MYSTQSSTFQAGLILREKISRILRQRPDRLPLTELAGREPAAGSPVESSTKEESSRTSSLCHHRRKRSRSPSTTTPSVTGRTQGRRFTNNTLVNWLDHRKRSPLREGEDHTAGWSRRYISVAIWAVLPAGEGEGGEEGKGNGS
nr:hypothetical protein Iba_chr03bCG7850 [Ipomoea batatas]